MAVDYLQEYLGIDPNDYSAMEQRIAGISPVGQSIIPRLGGARTPITPPTFVGGPPAALPIRPILRKEPTPDFGSQISGLEEQIAKLTEQMSLLETEKQKALEDQDIMRAELAQSQQDALAQQGEQFATERSALEQQIADLTAQVGQQPPADTPGGSQDMIDNMPPATGEGGLPDGYSYIPGPGSEGMAYTTVMPRQGFRYAYGPDGDRIQVPDNRPRIDRPLPPPPLPPREKLIPPNMLPPKRDDQLFIDDRPRFIDDRVSFDLNEDKMPVQGPAIKEPSPIAPPAQRPIGRPPLRREDVVPLRPREELITEGFIDPRLDRGQGTYKEFQGPDGRVISVGVKPPTFSTNPNPKKGLLVDNISSGIIGKNPVVSSGIGGIGARPDLPKPPQRPFFSKMIDRQPRQPMSVGGVGGISGSRSMRPMMRAGGGAIGQAIADLQNRLR